MRFAHLILSRFEFDQVRGRGDRVKRIMMTGDKNEVFNGECGAESGTVPVSAVAPVVACGDKSVLL